MDQVIEISLIFLPQILFIFLVGGFIKQDISSIFILPRYEIPKSMRFSNHIYLFIGIILISIIVFPYSIIGYINGTIKDFYDVAGILLAANGLIFIILAVISRFWRNVSYEKGKLMHKKYLKSVIFDMEKIEEIKIVKGIFFPDLEFYAEKRKIVINSFCSNLNTLFYLLAKSNNKALTKELLNELYKANKIYRNEEETLNTLLEVIEND